MPALYERARLAAALRVLSFTVVTSFVGNALAQPAPTPPPATANIATLPAEPSAATTLAQARWYDQLSLQGIVDTYFTYRLFGDFRDQVALRAFDTEAGTFQIEYARLGISFKPKPVGFQLDLGFGPIADAATIDPGLSGAYKYIVQGYVSFAIPTKRPIIIDVGKFLTSVCVEMVDSNLNWNYSHSYIFTFGPITHTGLRVLAPVTDWLSLQGSVVNGWDVVSDGNGFKTLNFASYLTFKDTSIALNYYAGPELAEKSPPWRHLVDVVLSQPLGKRFALNLNGTYGHEGEANWYGVALQGRAYIHEFFTLSARGEYFGDPDGRRTALKDASGDAIKDVHLGEVTLTAGIPLFSHAEVRVEGRQDFASKDIFRSDKSRLQTTFTAAAIAWF